MVNSKDILDALVRAGASSGPPRAGDATTRRFLHDAMEGFGSGTQGVGRPSAGPAHAAGPQAPAREAREAPAARPAGPWGRTAAVPTAGGDTGPSLDDLAQRARDAIGRNPGLAQAALLGVGGLLLGSRQGRGLASSLAGLGGVALISNLAYRAFERYQAEKPVSTPERPDQGRRVPSAPARTIELHPARATDADALLFVRAMIAAATADGHVDERERRRILDAFAQLGLNSDQARWLDQELARPATAEELARAVSGPEKAAQTYAAARLAIEPDTAEERQFLRALAEALKLDDKLKSEIDIGASGLKVEG